MQQYLLLRNNQQTGPYSLDQLLQLNLKPFDLVWADGRSAAWQYPGEVASLKAYVPATPQADQPYMPVATAVLDETVAAPAPQPVQQTVIPKKIFVSMPRTTVAAAAATSAYMTRDPEPAPVAAVAIPVTPVAPAQPSPTAMPAADTKYARSLNEVEEAYTNWMYDNKTKKKKKIETKDLAVAAVLLAFIGGGYFLLSRPALTASHPAAQTVAASVTPAATVAEEAVQTTQGDAPQTVAPANTGAVQLSTPASNEGKEPVKNKIRKTELPVTHPAEKTATTNIPVQEKPITRESPQNTESASPASTAPASGEAPAQKKKKLRDVFKGLFSKSKDRQADVKTEPARQEAAKAKPAPVLEEPRSANNRQATRRGDDGGGETAAAPTQESSASLADQVDISSNAPDSWMMGVSGLKVTLRNRSNSVLQNAQVEVFYYDQNDKLLDRKTINFSSVQPKGRQTLAAPDHKWADHVNFKLGTVTAKDDRYAGTK